MKSMEQPLGNEPLFDQADLESVKRLANILEMYEAWENGDYKEAKLLKDQLALPPSAIPWSIEALGDIWPHATDVPDARQAANRLLDQHLTLKEGKAGDPKLSFFAQPDKLLAYVSDELAKIKRLIEKNEDYRSAYLRAAGLDEFLLKARLAMCWLEGRLEVTVGSNQPIRTHSNDPYCRKGFNLLVNYSGADAMRNVLLGKQELNLRKYKVNRAMNCPQLEAYWKGKALDFDTFVSPSGNPGFTKLRGEAIHTHLYIPRNIAEAALELVRAAVEEFENNWLEHLHPGTLGQAGDGRVETPSWSHLCSVCGLSFLPPRLRL